MTVRWGVQVHLKKEGSQRWNCMRKTERKPAWGSLCELFMGLVLDGVQKKGNQINTRKSVGLYSRNPRVPASKFKDNNNP